MIWNDTYPIKELPKNLQKYFSDVANFLHSDLSAKRLYVVLIDAPYPRFEGHKIRSVVSRNPEWYRRMHQGNPNLKRKRSLSSLERISQKKDEPFQISHSCVHYPYFYDVLFRSLVKDVLVNGFYDEKSQTNVPPSGEIIHYFEELNRKKA